MADDVSELKPLLAMLVGKVDQVIATQTMHGERLSAIEHEQQRLAGEQERLAKEQERIKEAQFTNNGQMSVMLQWLQSMDQRFGALMAPITPPKQARGV